MYRLYRSVHTLLRPTGIWSRVPSGQTVRIERVRLKAGKPATRFLGTVVKGTLILNLILLAIPPVTREDSGREVDEESLFIPFPFTTKKHDPQPYSGTDPEWAEFGRISKDKERLSQIRRDVANLVLAATSNHPLITARAGKPLRIRRWWLDINFPFVAPPVYERSGLLITEEALEWVTVECDSYSAGMLDRVLWPRPLALSFWELGRETVKESMREIAKYIGYGAEASAGARAGQQPSSQLPTAPSPEVQKTLERLRQQATRRPEEVDDPRSMSSTGGPPSTSSSAAREGTVGSEPNKPTVNPGGREDPSQRGWLPGVFVSFAQSTPWKKFKETFLREFKPLKSDPPRGSILVTGLVELETPKAWISLDVVAWYNPKTGAPHRGSLRIFVRLIKPKVQAPLR